MTRMVASKPDQSGAVGPPPCGVLRSRHANSGIELGKRTPGSRLGLPKSVLTESAKTRKLRRMKPLHILLIGIAALLGPAMPADRGGKTGRGFFADWRGKRWRTAETESIRSEAKKRGVNLRFSDAQQKQENQIKALRAFLAQNVDAIILAPVVETGWEPVLKEIKRAKIPVVLVDRGINVSDQSLYATLIASDFVEEGRMAAAWLGKKLGGKGNIVELKELRARRRRLTARKGLKKG